MTYAVHVADDSCNTGQPCAATRDDADVFVGVLTTLVLTVRVVVQVGNRLTELCFKLAKRTLDQIKRQISG